MASRPSWSGYLNFNLISIPVKGYNATRSGGGKIGFHLVHKGCNNRIHYKKVCPVHGEVQNDEIVSGYEHEKGQYVEVAAEERGKLKDEDDKTIKVDAFIPVDAVEPVFFSGRSYFLVPDGKVAQNPYAVMLEAMRSQSRCAVARVVFAGRAQIAVVGPCEHVLAMTLLSYESQMRKPGDFHDEIDAPAVKAEERKLAESLIEAATAKRFDLGRYKDEYTDRLAKLVEGKSRRKTKTAGKGKEGPPIINLMDALRRSLDDAKKGRASPAARGGKKPARRKTG